MSEYNMNQTPEEKKDCGCGKNKNFKKQELPDQGGFLKRKMSMIQSFASSLTSRGVNNKKINRANKQLRVLSCIGNDFIGGDLPQCEQLKISKVDSTKRYCGACGCGDRKGTWLISDSNEYGKLDYPKVGCPLQMPGFTNYRESLPEEAQEPTTRKYFIEHISYKELEIIPVTLPQLTEKQEKAMEESQKRMQKMREEKQK
jgi:hypothetical protein